MHWSDKYVGEPYIPGEGDCAALAAKVALEVLGIADSLPVPHASGHRNQAKQVYEHKDNLAVRVDAPIEGHPILFNARGQTCHIGVACWLAGEWWVLHADQGIGFVIRERLRDMTRFRYSTEGFYKWN